MPNVQFDRRITSDLEWRESELTALKHLVGAAKKGSVAETAQLRALWAMLYAHYEGFTKFCWDSLLDEIQASRELVGNLAQPFLLRALEGDFRRIKGDLSPESLWAFCCHMNTAALAGVADFPDECRPETKSNLWPSVFIEESAKLGLSCTQAGANYRRLKSLVFRRNEIAHGKKLVISSLHEYRECEHAVLLVMHDLALMVIKVIENQEFRRPS